MNKLAQPTEQTRFLSAVGLSTTAPTEGRVDPNGGKFNAGLIRGVSVITRGEALGHGFWVDTVMLDQCQAAMQANASGLKSRFTHPGLCADGLAKKLGILMDSRRSGDQVLADLHFNTFAHRSPDGDLAGYVMARATEEPEHFGTSIVFISDPTAEREFMLANGGKIVIHDDGYETYETIEGFQSPDPDNVDNLPHARISELTACDVVDDPAANPNGFFHRDLSAMKDAEGFLDYALGLSDARPTTVSFGVDPDRARQFLNQWATQRGLSLLSLKGKPMSKLNKGKLATDPATPETPPADSKTEPTDAPVVPENDMVTCPKCGATFAVAEDDDTEPTNDEPQSTADYAAQHGKFVAAFGAENGTKWFFGKVKFSDAQKLHYDAQLAAKDQEIVSLKAQLKSANDRLQSIANEGADALGASPAPAGIEGGTKGSKGSAFTSLFKVPSNN